MILTRAEAADVILHCRQPSQDIEFAAKYGKARTTIRQIRLGYAWFWLRQELVYGPVKGGEEV